MSEHHSTQVHNKNDQGQGSLVKVKMIVENYYKGNESAIETLWALPIRDNTFRLENSPFYAYGYSYQDIVVVKKKDSELIVEGVVEHCGHSTFRIALKSEDGKRLFNQYWSKIESLGCTYEQHSEVLYVVDVPPSVGLNQVVELLQKGEKDEVWEYEEGFLFKADQRG